jgi:lipoprotein-anchoring transpeptidase ErfK/SrfK
MKCPDCGDQLIASKIGSVCLPCEQVVPAARHNHPSRKVSPRRRILLAAATAVFLFAAANVGAGIVYAHRIYPRVTISAIPVGNLTLAAATTRLQAELESKPVSLKLQGQTLNLSSQQAGLQWQTATMVSLATKQTSPLPLVNLGIHLFKPQAVQSIVLADAVATNQLAAQLAQKYTFQPVNASIVMQGQNATLVSDKSGAQYTSAQVSSAIMRAAINGKPAVVTGKAVPAQVSSRKLLPVVAIASKIAQCSVSLNIQGKIYQPDQQTLDSWITVDGPSATVTINQQAVAAYVATLAQKYDLAAAPTVITTLDGAVTGTQTGKPGQTLNQQAAVSAIVAALQQKTSLSTAVAVLPVAPATQYVRKVSTPASKRILVSINQQHLWAYDGNTQVYDSAVITGASALGDATPIGTWRIYSKVTNTHLIGPTWNDFVQFWMPFVGAYGLHDASWRDPSQFGTSTYPQQGSHGCVELPVATAAWLFNWAAVGTQVTIEP